MTHRYTILTGGLVLPGADEAPVTAIAWAGDTVIALGDDEAMLSLSRGDSRFVDLEGASVIPLGEGDPGWPVGAMLEVGGRADLAILASDPRPRYEVGERPSVVAVIRGGRVVSGILPGAAGGTHGDGDHRAAEPEAAPFGRAVEPPVSRD